MPILFFKTKEPYGCFSNFSRYNFTFAGRAWATSEHAFQAMKFHEHPELVTRVWAAETPRIAADLGRDRTLPLRPDWEARPSERTYIIVPQPDDQVPRPKLPEPIYARVKDVVMYDVCLAKFQQNSDIRKILVDTGDEPIIEDSSKDDYWGWGPSKYGENKLGRILMALRSALR
jgi:N-glycosidase YbiA